MRRISIFRLAAAGCALLALPALAETTASKPASPVSTSAGMPEVGRKAPNFALTGEDGKTYALQNQRGRWVALTFYPADFTGGCTAEACSLRDDMSKIKAMNARVFGISVQDAQSKKGFAEKNNLNYHVLADDRRVVSQAYGVLNSPTGVDKRITFYIDPYGVIRKIDTKVVPLTAAKDVQDSLKELQKSDPPLLSPVWDQNLRKWFQAVQKDPNDRDAKEELALAYYMKGRAAMLQPRFPARVKYPAAVDNFKHALALNPDLAAAQEDLAVAQKEADQAYARK
jgi:peroxiredoxin Q/BCP